VHVLRGLCMGAADVVPGVSGGTIALLLGIYDRLIDSARNGSRSLGLLLRGDLRASLTRAATVEWAFLLPLLVGIGIAVTVLAGPIEAGLADHPESMAGLFLGLVLASILIAWRIPGSWSRGRVGLTAVVAVVLFVALGWQAGPVADPSAAILFASGAVAICAMILPGISGAFLLLMLGMYSHVLAAVDDRMLGDLALFGLGAIAGLALFSPLLGRMLERHHDLVLAALVGLMIGSLRVLWPWPNGVGVIDRDSTEVISGASLDWPATSEISVPLLLATAAMVVVLSLDTLSRRHLGPTPGKTR
jgi:putative membrane protein